MFINPYLREATPQDSDEIWEILQQAIDRRKSDGSRQWQDGYPNLQTVLDDIEEKKGFVLIAEEGVIGYAALIFNDEPAYEKIEGNWLTNGEFLVVHRVAISNKAHGKGMAKKLFKLIEDFAKNKSVFSIKVDTNYDNPAMLSILEKLNYHYCGEVYFRGSSRKAFEKLLEKQ